MLRRSTSGGSVLFGDDAQLGTSIRNDGGSFTMNVTSENGFPTGTSSNINATIAVWARADSNN